MPEAGADYEPRAGNVITAARVNSHFDKALSEEDRWISGLDRTVVGLTLTLDPGFVHIEGVLVEFGSAVSKPLDASATNYVYAEKDADIVVSTSPAPVGTLLLYVFVTNGSGVTSETDNRPNVTAKVLEVDLEAPILRRSDPSALVDDDELVRHDHMRDYVQSNGGNKTVRYATTADIGLSGLGTQAGGDWPGALTAGDRVLVKAQAAGEENGIWVAAAGAWARATDYDIPMEVAPGGLIGVTAGTTLADTFWSLATEGPIVVGTTSLSFVQQDYRGHAALTTAHGSTSANTANAIAQRNGSGQVSGGDATNADHFTTKGQLDANATADRARANHTGTQLASTVSDFDTQVRTSRLDQMAAPTADVDLNGQEIVDLGAPLAPTSAARLQDVTERAPGYADIDTLTLAANGDVIAEGPLEAIAAGFAANEGVASGWFGRSVFTPATNRLAFHLNPAKLLAYTTTLSQLARLPSGVKLTVKGIYKARADAPFATAFDRLFIGLLDSPGAPSGNVTSQGAVANETETTRDDVGTIGVVVDDAENIKSYNCTAGGDASYTDSGHDANLDGQTAFEAAWEIPTAATDATGTKLTVKVQDNGGTMRTILNEAAPAFASATGNGLFLLFIMNQDAWVEKAWFTLEKVP